jgi:hypothetical protein
MSEEQMVTILRAADKTSTVEGVTTSKAEWQTIGAWRRECHPHDSGDDRFAKDV